MSTLSILVDTITRAAHAFALAIAPPLFAPEPGPGSITGALVAAVVLAAVVFGALRLAARVIVSTRIERVDTTNEDARRSVGHHDPAVDR
ncbi:MAG TPA: hypothetical protein VM694_36580, partial [Polyangium sp.]|nr:hypothetical protein [Polyangium sp.]